jgi:hypothetical protein
MKPKKLKLEKFRIAKLDDLAKVKGGTGEQIEPSLDTTNTTDPNVACPQYHETFNTNVPATTTANYIQSPTNTNPNANTNLTVP